jgi:2',3'-cyclic-nucleotide 2'-phosphodiesterase (5'-nucleotidase family)
MEDPLQTTPNNNLTIVHFNDAYEISEDPKRECVGGIARFANRINMIKKEDPDAVVFFSGDVNNNLDTSVFRGEQILPGINKCHIDAACLGNHDLVRLITFSLFANFCLGSWN